MAMGLRTLCFSIWKSKYERKGIAAEYRPVFMRYIGTSDPGEYPDILKTIYEKASECPYAVFFDGSVPMQAEFDLINYIGTELKSMDISSLKSQDIVLFDDPAWNRVFLESLDTIVQLAIRQENFMNESMRNNFIIKLIVWTYSYIRPMSQDFRDDHSPKCFYYGNIGKHEIYFLMMLYLMTFDVVYMNPLKEEHWESIDSLHLSTPAKSQQILPVKTYREMTADAKRIEEEQSITLQLQQEMEDTLLSGSGCYRAWQFREGYTKPLFIRSTVIDLVHNYAEPAKVRAGFKVDGKTVTVPNYFFQIDGLYNDAAEYRKLVMDCISTPNTHIVTDACRGFINGMPPEQEILQLPFCRLNDGSYDIQELKKLPFYKWDRYRDTLEDFMLQKINDVLSDCMFKKTLDEMGQYHFISDVLCMDETIIKMVDGFDFPDKVPKVVVFLEKEDYIEDRMLYLLGYIVTLGFDVVIFCPAGLSSIDSVFEPKRFNNERLDIMKYDCTLDEIRKKGKGGGFLKKLFGS